MRKRIADRDYADLSEAELDSQLARFETRASTEQREGGLPRSAAVIMLVCAAVAMLASLGLVVSEKNRLEDPTVQLSCDINSLVSCGQWIGSWQNELLFGISNSVVGLAFFAGVVALALVVLSGGRIGRRLWQALAVAFLLGAIWVVWFQYESFVVKRALCPYCYVVWLATIALCVLVWGRSLQAGHWGERAVACGNAVVRNRFLIVGGCYVALVVFTLIWFWDTWVMLF
ncbi:MAG: vitamin K epoxide reductase family protein [Arcanobacterium sp.]|nr:vitamin K epoxide reductase family protein [Arcanobacterium sp.]